MQRRDFLSGGIALTSIGLFKPALSDGARTTPGGALTRKGTVRVAFLLGDHANVIDTAGPWEVFQDAAAPDSSGIDGFELYTVAPGRKLLTMTGGLQVQPKYAFDDAPQPHVIVVPAHRGTPQSLAWLKRAHAGTDVTMSVCTGAFQLARAGLLEGLRATTHHDFFGDFGKEFPGVKLEQGLRFVDNGRIATAGGLTSGMDMALHVVSRYYGVEAAAMTAKYMEYTSEAWRG
jgi:transcriptional regulator GlxA family with amidase domain